MNFFKIYYILGCIVLAGIIIYITIRGIKNRELPLCIKCKHLAQYKGPHWRYTCGKSWVESRFDKAPKYCKFFEPFIPEDKIVTVSSDGLKKTITITRRGGV